MFIIPVAGMAKAVMAVTISLQPVAHQGPASYTVRAGDSLSAIAAHAYGSAADWPAVWWANRHQVANPACSSPSRPGSPTAAASTPPRPTWPPLPSRSPWPSGSSQARASAPGLCAGQVAKTKRASPACPQVHITWAGR